MNKFQRFCMKEAKKEFKERIEIPFMIDFFTPYDFYKSLKRYYSKISNEKLDELRQRQ